MAKRKNMICCLRKFDLDEAKNGYISRSGQDSIVIRWNPNNITHQVLSNMTTRDARLLAKRINQFLDAGG